MTAVNLEDVRAHVQILRYCKSRKAELKALEDAARAAVEEAMEDADDGLLDDQPAILWHGHKRRSLDQKALREDHPSLTEEYMTTTVVKRFEVVDE